MLRFHIDAFGELRQRFICFPFFIERLLKQLNRFLFLQELGIGSHTAIAGDFIVFDPLCGGNQALRL